MGFGSEVGDRHRARDAVRGSGGAGSDAGRLRARPGRPGVLRPSPTRCPPGKHGDIIWARELKRAPKGADAWRILYRSEDVQREATVSSGFLAAPEGERAEGRTVRSLAWAHGTEGLADNCAPLRRFRARPAELVDYFTYQSPFQQDTGVPGIKQFLDSGYAVVATDYAGPRHAGDPSSTSSPSPELRNVLDSIVATQRFAPAAGGKRAVVLGWSQGGGAAIWADQEARYAEVGEDPRGRCARAGRQQRAPSSPTRHLPGP